MLNRGEHGEDGSKHSHDLIRSDVTDVDLMMVQSYLVFLAEVKWIS